jgi:hypothetical protein
MARHTVLLDLMGMGYDKDPVLPALTTAEVTLSIPFTSKVSDTILVQAPAAYNEQVHIHPSRCHRIRYRI